MGVIKVALGVTALYLGATAAARSAHAILSTVQLVAQAVMALGRAAHVLWLPPGALPYTGGPTWWYGMWYFITLGPLWALFAPGSFFMSYSLLVVPALAVGAVALASLAAHSPLGGAVREAWRQLLGGAACVAAALLLADAVQRCALAGRAFPAALRGSVGVWLGFGGLVLAMGKPDDGGFSTDQIQEWSRALLLTTAAATTGVGGGSLLQQAATVAATAADRLAFLGYGSVLLLVAVCCASALTGSPMLLRGLRALLRALLALVGVDRLLLSLLRGLRAALQWRAVRAVVAGVERADVVLTQALVACGRAVASSAAAARDKLLPAARGLHRYLLAPACRAVVRGLKAAARGARAAASATRRHVLLPLARALRTAARAAARAALAAARLLWRAALRPVLRLLRLYAAPVLWPAGAVAGMLWFGQQAALQRSVLPFGAAAYVSALVVALMAGKAMRKSRSAACSRVGAALEGAAAAAYLRLDLGTGELLARLLLVAARTAALGFVWVVNKGSLVVALFGGPLLAALWMCATAAMWGVEQVVLVLGPHIRAVYRWVRSGVLEVWRHPELALVAAAAAVALAYGAHVMGLPAAAARGVWWALAAAGGGVLRALALLLSPPLRLLRLLALRAAQLLGLSAGASASAAHSAASALAGWGARAATDVTSLFASATFGGAFVGLNLAHCLALRAWVAAELKAGGAGGAAGGASRAAVLPVVSFVARSTGKVALGPMYLVAAVSFLAGGGGGGWGGGVAARLCGLTAPALWLLYLAALWVEGARRVRLSYDARNDSELSRALRGLREARASAAAASRAADAARAVREDAAAAAEQRQPRPQLQPQQPQPQQPQPRQPPQPQQGADLDPLEARLLADLRSQPMPGHVYPTDCCAVCCEEVAGLRAGPLLEAADADAEADGGAEAAQVLRCGHAFHRSCVLQWLRRSPRCPICREPAVGRSRHANMLF